MNDPASVDTLAWIATISPKDNYHLAAQEGYGVLRAQKRHQLISNFIVAETYIHPLWKLRHHKASPLAVRFALMEQRGLDHHISMAGVTQLPAEQ
jgi:hypothetical protein